MDDFIKELQRRDDEKLESFIEAFVHAFNIGVKNGIHSIELTNYESEEKGSYSKVLKVCHGGYKVAYINIAENSVKASVEVLLQYMSTKNCQGLIEVTHNGY